MLDLYSFFVWILRKSNWIWKKQVSLEMEDSMETVCLVVTIITDITGVGSAAADLKAEANCSPTIAVKISKIH